MEKQYKKIKEHWSNTSPTISGILNGYPESNKPDVEFSNKLLNYIQDNNLLNNFDIVLDCACGIGRVTENVLINYFKKIDMFERENNFINYLNKKYKNNNNINVFKNSLQNFNQNTKIICNKYNCIWIQWCLENLSKNDINKFLKKCEKILDKNGIIIIKENCINDIKNKNNKNKNNNKKFFAEEDFSEIRTLNFYLNIIKKNKFKIIKYGINENWPKKLIPLYYFILKKQ